jgi:hypothetical protein
VVAGNLPILDYSRRESFAYVKEPTQGNLDALHAKQSEAVRTRWFVRLSAWRAGNGFCDSYLSQLSVHETKEEELKPGTANVKT